MFGKCCPCRFRGEIDFDSQSVIQSQLNKSTKWRVDGRTSHIDDAESDSDDDIQRLRELMEKSFNGDTESDDENYVPSGEDYDTSDVPTSDEELNDGNEIAQLHNGLNETFEKKVRQIDEIFS